MQDQNNYTFVAVAKIGTQGFATPASMEKNIWAGFACPKRSPKTTLQPIVFTNYDNPICYLCRQENMV
jgi:hypothetical protein